MPAMEAQNKRKNGGSRISPVDGDTKAMGIPTMRNIMTINRYLSTYCDIYKTIYLFDLVQAQA